MFLAVCNLDLPKVLERRRGTAIVSWMAISGIFERIAGFRETIRPNNVKAIARRDLLISIRNLFLNSSKDMDSSGFRGIKMVVGFAVYREKQALQ